MFLVLKPKTIIVDFEKAIHTAIQNVFPSTVIHGCLFHLKQAWYRKIQQLNLSVEYCNKNSEIGKWLRYVFGLPFVPSNEVGDCFLELMEFMPANFNLSKFADYLVDFYIEENCDFSPAMWAELSSSVSRTTNACESFHSHLKNNFYSSHPSIFAFLDVLISFQAYTYSRIQSANRGIKKLSKDVRNKKETLQKLIENYGNGILPRIKFVKTISYHNKPML
jgi:hypothetical protein